MSGIDLSILETMRHGRNPSLTLSERSLKVYEQVGRQFNAFLEKKNLDINEDSIRLFFKENNWAATTVNLKRQALMKLLQNQDGIKQNYLEIAAVREMFKMHVPRTKQIRQAIAEDGYLTQEQVRKLINVCSERIGLIVEFLFVTGCRISEMINIRRGDVIEGNVCKINIIGKGSKQRIVFAEKRLINDIYRVFKGSVYLFESRSGRQLNRNNISNEIKRFANKIRLKNVHPHIFRHSCAMHLKRMGKTPDFIQKYLGHADVSTTLRFYFHHEPKADTVKLFQLR